MKTFKENALVNTGFIIVLTVVVFIGMITFRDLKIYRTESQWVNHTYKVIEINTLLLSNLKDAETGTRGFVISGDSSLLAPYTGTYNRHRELINRLKVNTADQPIQQARVDSLINLCELRFELLNDLIERRVAENFEIHSVFPLYKAVEAMDRIRFLSTEIDTEARRLLHERQQNVITSFHSTQRILKWALILSVITLAILFYFLKRQIIRRRKAQQETFNTHEWYSRILVSLGDGVIATDHNHVITYMNKAAEEITNWRAEQVKGEKIEKVFNIINEFTRQPVPIPTVQALAEKRNVLFANHTLLITKDGNEVFIEDSAAPVLNSDGNIIGAVLIFRNITEQANARKLLKRMNEELEEIVKERTQSLQLEIKSRKETEQENQKLITSLMQHINNLQQFTYIVSHNLRSPVAKILGLTDLFANADEAVKNFIINALAKEAGQLDTVIKDLSIIVNIRNNQTENHVMLNVSSETKMIAGTLQEEIRKSGAFININCNADKTVYAIKSYFVSILSNLVGNAIKYRDPGRQLTITVSCSENDKYDIITVEDNGLGIDLTRNKDKIFGLYKRFHSNIEGRGIGLHISQTQMKMMEGKIEVESEPGKGTKFTLSFVKKSIPVYE